MSKLHRGIVGVHCHQTPWVLAVHGKMAGRKPVTQQLLRAHWLARHLICESHGGFAAHGPCG